MALVVKAAPAAPGAQMPDLSVKGLDRRGPPELPERKALRLPPTPVHVEVQLVISWWAT